MDAIEFNEAKPTLSIVGGLRKLENKQADAAGKAAAGLADAGGGLGIGRRLVVMVRPDDAEPETTEETRHDRGRHAAGGAAAKSGVVQVVDHGANQKESIRRLFDAHVMIASLEEQLTEKELLIGRLSQQLFKVGLDSEKTEQPAAGQQPAGQPGNGPSKTDKQRMAQEKVLQQEASKEGMVRKGFPKWLQADEQSRQAIEKVWNMILSDYTEKDKVEKTAVVHSLWTCGYDFALRWGGDPNEQLQDQVEALSKKYAKVQRDSQKEISMLRQHIKKTEIQYKKLQEYSLRMKQASEDRRTTLASTPPSRDNSKSQSFGELSVTATPSGLRRTMTASQMSLATPTAAMPGMPSPLAAVPSPVSAVAAPVQASATPSQGRRSREAARSGKPQQQAGAGVAIAPVAMPSQGSAAPAPETPAAAATKSTPVARAKQAKVGIPQSQPPPALAPVAATPSPMSRDAGELSLPVNGGPSRSPSNDPLGEVRAMGNRGMVEDDTLMVSVAESDLAGMDHEVFEAIKNLDEDQQEMMIDMVNDKVRRILSLDPSKWTDGRLPFGLRADSTPPDVIKLEAENKHLRAQLMESEQDVKDLEQQLERLKLGSPGLDALPSKSGNTFMFGKAMGAMAGLGKGGGRPTTKGSDQATDSHLGMGEEEAEEARKSKEKADRLEREAKLNEARGASKDGELKSLRDQVSELEAKLKKQLEDLRKAEAQKRHAESQLADKEKELKERLSKAEAERRQAEQQLMLKEGELKDSKEAGAKALAERPKADGMASRSASRHAAGSGAGSGAGGGVGVGRAERTFWVEADKSSGELGIDLSKEGVALRVDRVDAEGQISQWNQQNPDSSVAEGDMILEINGVSGDADELMKAYDEHGLLKMKLRAPQGAEKSKGSSNKIEKRALKKTQNMLHHVLSQVAVEKDMVHTESQRQLEELIAFPSPHGAHGMDSPPSRLNSQGTQCGELTGTRPSTVDSGINTDRMKAVSHFENWIDELLPSGPQGGGSEEELKELRQRCKAQQEEIARLVLIIDELRARMEKIPEEAPPELAGHVGGLLKKVGLKEVVDTGIAAGRRGGTYDDSGLRQVYQRLYQDAVQRIQRFAVIRETVKATNKAFMQLADSGGAGAAPDLERLNATAAAALNGMWYGSDYIFKRMCEYAITQGVEALVFKAHTSSVAEIMGNAAPAIAEDTDAPVMAKVGRERLPPGRRMPRGGPLPGGFGGDAQRSPRQQQLRKAQLADPEPTPFTCYMASMKEARGDLHGDDWARASLAGFRKADGKRPSRTDELGVTMKGSAGLPRAMSKGGTTMSGARSLPALPRIRGATEDEAPPEAPPPKRVLEPGP